MAIKNAPIQTEDTKSSIPSHLENPSPAPIATTQTGQTCADTKLAKVNPRNNNPKNIYLFMLLNSCCCF